MVMDLLKCDIDLGIAGRGDKTTLEYLEDGKNVISPLLVISWTEEVRALNARRLHLGVELDQPFQKQYELLYFRENPEQTWLETKD